MQSPAVKKYAAESIFKTKEEMWSSMPGSRASDRDAHNLSMNVFRSAQLRANMERGFISHDHTKSLTSQSINTELNNTTQRSFHSPTHDLDVFGRSAYYDQLESFVEESKPRLKHIDDTEVVSEDDSKGNSNIFEISFSEVGGGAETCVPDTTTARSKTPSLPTEVPKPKTPTSGATRSITPKVFRPLKESNGNFTTPQNKKLVTEQGSSSKKTKEIVDRLVYSDNMKKKTNEYATKKLNESRNAELLETPLQRAINNLNIKQLQLLHSHMPQNITIKTIFEALCCLFWDQIKGDIGVLYNDPSKGIELKVLSHQLGLPVKLYTLCTKFSKLVHTKLISKSTLFTIL